MFRIGEALCATPSGTFLVIERCCRTCPGASIDQRFTSGDVKGMPCGIGEVIAEYRHAKPVVKRLVITNVGAGQHLTPAVT
jgi:hypothetical protein